MRHKHIRPFARACAVLVATLGLAGSAAAQSRGITVYSDINFSGNSQTFRNDVSDLVSLAFNDTISSIEINDGGVWQICADVNFQNRCQNINRSISDLRSMNWNDQISSIRRVSGPGGFGNRRYGDYTGDTNTNSVILHDNPNFRGQSVTLSGDTPDLRNYGMNDRVTSIEIPNGESWEICVDINYGNQCTVISDSVADLRDMGWNDRVSSMRRVSGRRSGGLYRDREYGTQQGLVFYDRANYRGESAVVTRSANTNLDLQQGSVRVRGGGVWRVCDAIGDCVTIDEDVPNLRRLGLRDRITSVRTVNTTQNRRWWYR